jgi:hypothetical protein
MQLHSGMWTHAVVCSGKEKKEYYMCTLMFRTRPNGSARFATHLDEKSGNRVTKDRPPQQ